MGKTDTRSIDRRAATVETCGLLRSLLLYYGTLPFRARRFMRFYAGMIRPGDLCFDVGAHVGSRLPIWSRLGARTVAVEPQPSFARFLRRWYGRQAGVILVQAALGAAPGLTDLHVSRRTPTVTSLSPKWIQAVQRTSSFKRVHWDATVQVQVTTLDALIAQYGEPAFVKIDVEGFEPEVLKGLSQPLRCLSLEFIPAAADLAVGCIQRLERLARYEYNYALSESARFQNCSWQPGGAMAAWLDSLPPDHPSGDVYARRIS